MARGSNEAGKAVAALAIAALIACVWRTAAHGPEAGTWLAIAALVANLVVARRAPAPAGRDRPATSDAATGLLTRGAFVEAGGGLLRDAARKRRGAALLLVAIAPGDDEALSAAADTLRRALPGGGLAGRIDDAALALLVGFDRGHPHTVDALAEHLHGALARPVAVRGRGVALDAAIGIAEADREATIARLIDAARAAAAAGRHRPARFDAAIARAYADRRAAAAALADGIAADRFVPCYRPIADADGRPIGFEVAPDGDPALPAVAAAAGLAADLTAATMRRALAEARDWDAGLTLSFAITRGELADPWLAQKIVRQLVETGFPARRLEIAAPAHALCEAAAATLLSLANQGVRIALTGVGGAGSLLGTAAALPIARLEPSPALAAKPALAAALGGALGVPVVAAGNATPLGVGAVRRLLAERGLLPAARAAAPPLPVRRTG